MVASEVLKIEANMGICKNSDCNPYKLWFELYCTIMWISSAKLWFNRQGMIIHAPKNGLNGQKSSFSQHTLNRGFVGLYVAFRSKTLDLNKTWLVVWNMNSFFHSVGKFHHPNWRTDMFQRGRCTTNQKHMGFNFNKYCWWNK
jgi:hypothetical protein